MPSPAQIAKNKVAFLFKKDPLKAVYSVLDAIQKAGDEAKNEMVERARADFESHIAQMEASHREMMDELMANLKLQLEAKMQALPLLKGDKGDSIAGPKGERGEAGPEGSQGERGEDGKDANPEDVVPLVIKKLPKPEELKAEKIAEKLNTLEEKIDRKVIRGLDRELSVMKQNIRAKTGKQIGGGGMGNVVEFQFTGDGSTTSFTLSGTVAAGGKAIVAHYQGQYIHRGTHFTISGSTLATTFTADDGTIIEGWFIRG